MSDGREDPAATCGFCGTFGQGTDVGCRSVGPTAGLPSPWPCNIEALFGTFSPCELNTSRRTSLISARIRATFCSLTISTTRLYISSLTLKLPRLVLVSLDVGFGRWLESVERGSEVCESGPCTSICEKVSAVCDTTCGGCRYASISELMLATCDTDWFTAFGVDMFTCDPACGACRYSSI